MKLTRRKFVSLTAAAPLALQGAARAPKKKDSINIVFYTDLHTRVEWETPQAVLKCAEMINDLNPDLVICGGDMITDGFQASPGTVDARWEAYLAMHERIKAPLLSCIGNHDLVGAQPDAGPAAPDPRSEFRDRVGVQKTWSVHDRLGHRILLLDSMNIFPPEQGRYEGRIDGEQLQWLKTVLADTPKDMPLIVVTHMPWLSSLFAAAHGNDQTPPDGRLVQNNKELIRLFLDHNLKLVLQGHLHVYEKIFWRGTTYITGGAVCGRWWRGDYHGTSPGFVSLSLSGDEVESRYVEIPWNVKRPGYL